MSTMPDQLIKHMIQMRGGAEYLPASYRIAWFREEHPDWGILTSVIEGGHEAGFATVQATVMAPDGRVIAMGTKTETRQDFPAGWVEKAETGAVARALMLAGYGAQLDDESSSQNTDLPAPTAKGAPVAAIAGALWAGPGKCPQCNAPEGRRHGNRCV